MPAGDLGGGRYQRPPPGSPPARYPGGSGPLPTSGPEVKIKAAGGIPPLQDAEDFINLGVDRIGTSAIVKLVKGETPKGY